MPCWGKCPVEIENYSSMLTVSLFLSLFAHPSPIMELSGRRDFQQADCLAQQEKNALLHQSSYDIRRGRRDNCRRHAQYTRSRLMQTDAPGTSAAQR